ncbi:MAG: hypothetical protein LUH05_00260 [Candidatus Gastranaerophilales bacterium]|nr:hypothetical protein [Candidatus Gastranaerophilales bacterium]
MKINNDTANKYSPSYKGIWNNKALLKGLETISEHGTTFVAATTLIMSAGIRPIAISLTPDTDKKNKQYAVTNSIASGIIKFGLVEAIALPVENAVKQIDKTPKQYLSPKTVRNLQSNAKSLKESRVYNFATQLLKQSSGFITAIPKSALTVALIPPLMDILFNRKKENNKKEKGKEISAYNTYNPVFSPNFDNNNGNTPSFKGALSNQAAKGIGKILNADSFQKFAKKCSGKDADIARNMSMATDLLLTSSFIYRTSKSDKIEQDRKKALIANNVISTGLTLLGGYSIDNIIKKNTGKFIKKFSEINKNDPKLNKYIEGINIVRPTLIFAGLYYGILPIFSTYLADKTDKFTRKEIQK